MAVIPDNTTHETVPPAADLARLIRSKDFFHLFINSIPSGFLMLDESGKIIETNEAYCRISGYAADELRRMNLSELKAFASGEEDLALFNQKGVHFETRHLRKNGTAVDLEVDSVCLLAECELICAFYRDITERKAAEHALRRQERLLSAITDAAPSLIYVYDVVTGENIHVNNKAERHLGYTAAEIQAMGKGFLFHLIHTDDHAAVIEHFGNVAKLTDGDNLEVEYRIRHKSGEWRWLRSHDIVFRRDLHGKPRQTLGFAEDITERRQTEQSLLESAEQLRQAQKIEAVGRLAGGIAHDFNNFLAVVMLQVDMLGLQLPAESPLRNRLGEIKNATTGAAGMVRQLLAFSRKQMLQPRPLILNHVVTEAGKMLHHLIGADVELDLRLDANLGVCLVDPDQIMQVLVNLAVNARDAMPDGGKLLIETKNVRLDEKSVRHKAQPAGWYVEIRVTDEGTGMDAVTREHLFEPFFTTKEAGKGSGLGLSTVYGIVKQSGGFIWVTSEKNHGTIFTIQLPRLIEPLAEGIAGSVAEEKSAARMPGGDETILLAEDEELIRNAAREVLQMLGYRVIEAADGRAALELAERTNAPIHLLLTDVIMPKMNGRELAERLGAVHPETRVLFMSGYTDDIIAHHGILENGTEFIGKPFTPATLAVKIRKILDS